MPHVTAIANNKGGVGKSELTAQLAAALARRGLRVLVLDMDPQANASRRLGVEWDPSNPTPTISEVIKADTPGAGEGAVVACGWVDNDEKPTREAELIDVIPARFDLINRETEAGVVGAVRRLKKSLEGWADEYDVVLIDTRPDLGHLVQMAFAAADVVVIPADPNYDSIEGAIRVDDFVSKHAADLGNPGLKVGGVVVTRRKNTSEQDFQIAGLTVRFGELVWKLGGVYKAENGAEVYLPPFLPEWSRFAEADSAAVSLTAWTDERARETVGLYDRIATHYVDRFLTENQESAA